MVIPLYLVRHGAVENGLKDGATCLPFPDSLLEQPLSPWAQKQLTAVAAQLPDHAHEFLWISTDLPRAQQSASLLAKEFAQLQELSPNQLTSPKISVLSGGAEQYFGDWCGKNWSEIERDFPDQYQRFWQDAWQNSPPDGESFMACSRRIRAWFRQICVTCTQINAKGMVMICHAGTIRVIAAEMMKLPPPSALQLTLDLPYWSVTHFVLDPHAVTAHLTPIEGVVTV
ncbi:MAG: histidine phosphatase family protein [Alphaproteobacteria bacterium]|nr:histidine phosphatase family protein [Alphaproteobacteria bacterium]